MFAYKQKIQFDLITCHLLVANFYTDRPNNTYAGKKKKRKGNYLSVVTHNVYLPIFIAVCSFMLYSR